MGRPALRHDRRGFLRGSLAAAGVGLLWGCALPPPPWTAPKRRPKLGFVSIRTLAGTPEYAAFAEELRRLGYVPGETIQLEFRSGFPEHLAPDLATLTHGNADVLVAVQNGIIRAAQQATNTVPIVMVASSDPVRSGLVASLARPGGNVTGVSPLIPELAGKRLELLKEALPTTVRVGLVWAHGDVDEVIDLDEVQFAAQKLGLQLVLLEWGAPNSARKVQAIGDLFSAGGIDALLVGSDPPLLTFRDSILRMAAERRLPVMYSGRDMPAAGDLMAYGPNIAELFRRVASYVDKILKGAKPAELPVEQPTTFDFAINLRTAQALGLTIPQSVLQQATDVIQ